MTVQTTGPIQGHMPPTEGPALPRRDRDWRERAECLTRDPEEFFAMPSDVLQIAAAKAVCAGCPVRRNCLRLAFSPGAGEGVYGGADETDRRRAQRRVSRAGVAPTVANLVAATERLLAEQVSS
jgi:WhiB family redox-sensing transcriptional regulator